MAHEPTGSGRPTKRLDKFAVERRFRLRKFTNESGTGRLVGRQGNDTVASCEKLLLLELDALPGWIGQDHVKAVLLEDFGEFKRPVEETLANRNRPGPTQQARVELAARQMLGDRCRAN